MKTKTSLLALAVVGICLAAQVSGAALPRVLGDFNGDDVVDVRDLVLLIDHVNGIAGLTTTAIPFADKDKNFAVKAADMDRTAYIILELYPAPSASLTRHRSSSL